MRAQQPRSSHAHALAARVQAHAAARQLQAAEVALVAFTRQMDGVSPVSVQMRAGGAQAARPPVRHGVACRAGSLRRMPRNAAASDGNAATAMLRLTSLARRAFAGCAARDVVAPPRKRGASGVCTAHHCAACDTSEYNRRGPRLDFGECADGGGCVTNTQDGHNGMPRPHVLTRTHTRTIARARAHAHACRCVWSSAHKRVRRRTMRFCAARLCFASRS